MKRVLAGVFGVGALTGLLVGLAVGPTGAALVGFQLPYLKLDVADSGPARPAAPAPIPAVPIADAAVAAPAPRVQPAAMVNLAPQPLVAPVGRPLEVGVFGDSMADGLWAALYRDLRKEGAVDVLRLARNSTGLTRYDYVDVQAQTQDQLAQHHVDVAIVMFGANDGQGIIDGGKVYAFDTPAWRAAYVQRIRNLVQLLRSQGATVYWVGLPRMEKDYFDKRSQLLNGIYQEQAAALGVPFIDTVPVTVDEQGRYSAYLTSPGDAHKKLMRAPDGVHMTMAGYLRLAGPVVQRLRQDLAAARPPAAPAATPASAPALTATPTTTPPPSPSPAPMAMGTGIDPIGPVETAEQP